MNIRRILICFSVGIIFPLIVDAQKTQSDTLHITLAQIFSRIDTAYPSLAVYQAKNNALKAQAAGAKSWMPPTISLGLDKFPYQPGMLMVKGPENQAGVMISAQQMIPNPAKLNAKKNTIESQYGIQTSDSIWTSNALHSNAKYYYNRLCIAQMKLKIIAESRSALTLLIATAQARYQYNQGELGGIYKAQAKLLELNNMELMLRAEISESTIGLNILMNRDPLLPLSTDTNFVLTNYSFLAINDTVIGNRGDILSMNYSIQYMKASQNQMALDKKPEFGIAVTHSQMLGMENQYSVMGMMTIPIAPWSSGMYKSQVKAMSYEIISMQQEKATMQLMARQMATEKLSMFNFEKQQYFNYRDSIVPAYKSNYDVSLLAYRQNTGNLFVLLDA
ncbi:MAG TPA: TolC family protein, partial [Bacteroidia bacterium]|nr:TolC family protein [Bacteroidia bacterium]